MEIDARTTLMLTAILAIVAGGVLLAFEYTQKPRISHLRTWAFASLLQGLGLTSVMGLRELPAYSGIVAGNLLLVFALTLYASAVAKYADKPARRGTWLLVLTAYAFLHGFFLYGWYNLAARIAIFSLFAAGIMLFNAYTLRYPLHAARPGERFVAALFALTALGMLLRAVAQYPFAPVGDEALYASSGHAGVFHLMALVFHLVITLGFTVICIERMHVMSHKALSEIDSQRELFRRHFEMLPVAACIWRIEGDDYVLEQANFAAQVLTEGRIWTQTGSLASQLLARYPEAIDGLNRCRDQNDYFVREVPAGLGIRDIRETFNLTFSRISPQHIAVYGEPKQAVSPAEA